jgi:hypothetical protein
MLVSPAASTPAVSKTILFDIARIPFDSVFSERSKFKHLF